MFRHREKYEIEEKTRKGEIIYFIIDLDKTCSKRLRKISLPYSGYQWTLILHLACASIFQVFWQTKDRISYRAAKLSPCGPPACHYTDDPTAPATFTCTDVTTQTPCWTTKTTLQTATTSHEGRTLKSAIYFSFSTYKINLNAFLIIVFVILEVGCF